MSVLSFLYVFLGGGLGATLRWIITVITYELTNKLWAGTLLVNVIGGVVFILLSKFLIDQSETSQLILKVGILGGLTTFSTFSYEVVSLFIAGKISEALLVIALNLLFTIGVGILIFKT